MQTRLLEIRDRATLIPALAIQVSAADGPIMRRAGFGDVPMVYLLMLATQECQYDSFAWGPARTMGVAHRYIETAFDDLADGDVVDVEFILGERPTKKAPACVEAAV